MTTVRSVPSVRAAGAFSALVPEGWNMDEWRGGTCAALTLDLHVAGHDWEVVALPDGDLSLPVDGDDDVTVWTVLFNRWDDDADGTFQSRDGLDLPAFKAGDTFPQQQVEDWVKAQVAAGHFELV